MQEGENSNKTTVHCCQKIIGNFFYKKISKKNTMSEKDSALDFLELNNMMSYESLANISSILAKDKAISFLETLGNFRPSEYQICVVELLLHQIQKTKALRASEKRVAPVRQKSLHSYVLPLLVLLANEDLYERYKKQTTRLIERLIDSTLKAETLLACLRHNKAAYQFANLIIETHS